MEENELYSAVCDNAASYGQAIHAKLQIFL